ncbi:MAG: SMC-Scp complex subunit ScpB [Solirubrobacteraceae bacterium]
MIGELERSGPGVDRPGHEPAGAELERQLEGLLFLSADPVGVRGLAEAIGAQEDEVAAGLASLRERFTREGRGLVVRELAGGWTLSTHPDVEPAARRLLAKPRTPPLTGAQAETLAIIAYLQPVSRPEIARIRGVSAESATQTLLERGIVEESGRSQFGAVLYRTTDLFLKLFGLRELGELPEIDGFDPSAELEHELRERLLRAGEARAGIAGVVTGSSPDSEASEEGTDGDAPEPDEL